ncbi:aminopeptidase N-like, partial [Hoplias malabaricus]|uniref:aminopeptidase N-like n=1 Tax=Hoplias malabaricus TaxID=27720 RepID=UPI0034637A6D
FYQWFGNLMTLKWWNEVWLNEGFATYVSYLGADYAEPTWNLRDLSVLEDHRVFAVDASSRPLSSKEEDILRTGQISEVFDAISYSTGASVLRMLSDFLTESVFLESLKGQDDSHQFGSKHNQVPLEGERLRALEFCSGQAGLFLPDV